MGFLVTYPKHRAGSVYNVIYFMSRNKLTNCVMFLNLQSRPSNRKAIQLLFFAITNAVGNGRVACNKING